MTGGADEPLKLVGVGGLVPHKGPLAALDAMIELNARGIDASLTWAGVGPLDQALLERSVAAGVRERLCLLGHVDPEALGDVLLAHHMFVLPTDGETFGVAIAEALGHGLPVVTSGVGGHLDFLPPEASRVAASESAALADAIVALRNDPTRWGNAEIRDYAETQFSEDVRGRHYQGVYASASRRAQIEKR
nr:glycosyltransferase family 4 protein [Leucobacter komagatae]